MYEVLEIFGTVFGQSGLNFRTVFGQFELKFQDCFRTVRVEILGLFSDSLDRIFETIFGQSEIGSRFGFNPVTDVYRFCGVLWYHSNSMTNHEGTKRCLVLYGSEILTILCVIVGKINNMMLCVKIMLIYTCLTY